MIGLKRPLAVFAVIAGLSGGSALADEVHEQLAAARAAYDKGELRGAVQALQFAVTKIQEQMTAKLRQLLPEPLPGWRADEPQSQTAGILTALTGTNLSRRYYNEDDGAEVELGIMADSPMMGMLTMMFASPFLMQASPGTSAFTQQGYRGLLEHAQDSDEWEAKVMVGSRTFLQLTGRGLADKAPLQAYLDALDLQAIEKAMSEVGAP